MLRHCRHDSEVSWPRQPPRDPHRRIITALGLLRSRSTPISCRACCLWCGQSRSNPSQALLSVQNIHTCESYASVTSAPIIGQVYFFYFIINDCHVNCIFLEKRKEFVIPNRTYTPPHRIPTNFRLNRSYSFPSVP